MTKEEFNDIIECAIEVHRLCHSNSDEYVMFEKIYIFQTKYNNIFERDYLLRLTGKPSKCADIYYAKDHQELESFLESMTKSLNAVFKTAFSYEKPLGMRIKCWGAPENKPQPKSSSDLSMQFLSHESGKSAYSANSIRFFESSEDVGEKKQAPVKSKVKVAIGEEKKCCVVL